MSLSLFNFLVLLHMTRIETYVQDGDMYFLFGAIWFEALFV